MQNSSDTVNYEANLHALVQQFIDDVDPKYGIICNGLGSSLDRDRKEIINVSLHSSRRATVEEARTLLLVSMERFLHFANLNQKNKSLANEFPLDHRNVYFSFTFGRGSSMDFRDGSVSHVLNVKDRIYYLAGSPFHERSVDLLEETLDEAKEYIRLHPLPYDPKYHKDPGYEAEIDNLAFNYLLEINKKHGLLLTHFGGEFQQGISSIAFKLVSKKKISLEQAQKMQKELNQILLSKINSNEKLKPFLKPYPFTIKNVFIDISFYKNPDRVKRFPEGSMFRVIQHDGKTEYYENVKPDSRGLYYPDDGRLVLEEKDLL